MHSLLINQPEAAVDMEQRFAGHCNVGTDIKQANFLGQRGMFICNWFNECEGCPQKDFQCKLMPNTL